MSQVIKISLSIGLIRETVENETYHRSKFDKATKEGAAFLAYLEAAETDETYQGRIFARDMYAAIEEVKTLITDYLNNIGCDTASNVQSETVGDNVVMQIEVSSRFNKSMSAPLARTISKYIEDYTLALWWSSINVDLMKIYQEHEARDIIAIQRCFNKVPPIQPDTLYATYVRTDADSVTIDVGESYVLPYTVDYGAIDDISASVADGDVCRVTRRYDGFVIHALKAGETTLLLASAHRSDVKAEVTVTVEDPNA